MALVSAAFRHWQMLRHIHNLYSSVGWLGRLASLAAAAVIIGGCGSGNSQRRPGHQRHQATSTTASHQKGFGNFAVYTLQISASDNTQMFVINGVPISPFQKDPPFDSRGSLRFGALCDGAAKATLIVTGAHSGNIFQESVPMRITHSALDGTPVRCPLRSLSKEPLDVLTLRLSMPSGLTVALLEANPQRPGDGLFSLLKVPLLRYTYKAAVPRSPLLVDISLSESRRLGALAHRHLVALQLNFSY